MQLMGGSPETNLELALVNRKKKKKKQCICFNGIQCETFKVLFFLGMGAESKDFAGELYDALVRRRQISTTNGITREELRMFWEDMTNQDIDSRLQIFFDM